MAVVLFPGLLPFPNSCSFLIPLRQLAVIWQERKVGFLTRLALAAAAAIYNLYLPYRFTGAYFPVWRCDRMDSLFCCRR